MQVIEAQYLDHWGLTITSISNMCGRCALAGALIADLAEDASTLLYPGERRKFANGRAQPRSAVGAVQAWVISGQPRIDIT